MHSTSGIPKNQPIQQLVQWIAAEADVERGWGVWIGLMMGLIPTPLSSEVVRGQGQQARGPEPSAVKGQLRLVHVPVPPPARGTLTPERLWLPAQTHP